MAIVKIWAVRHTVSHVAGYDVNPEKTFYAEATALEKDELTDGKLISAVCCCPETAVEEMQQVKEHYGKTGGVLAYHGYISFSPTDNLSPMDVLSVSKEIAQEMWGDQFQVLLSEHLGKNPHCHFLTNSVSWKDGHKAHGSENNYYRLRAITDKVCARHGLSKPVPKTECLPDSEIERALVTARQQSRTYAEFSRNLRQYGIYCNKSGMVSCAGSKPRYIDRFNPSLHLLLNFPKTASDLPVPARTVLPEQKLHRIGGTKECLNKEPQL